MPVNRRQGAAAAAFCLALGGAAVITWAFSVFSEDKKKPGSGKSLKAPTGSNGSLADPARSGSSTPVCRSKEPSPALSERAGLLGNKAAARYGPGKSDILPEGLFYPKDEKRPSMVFENKSATQSLNSLNSEREGYPVYEKLKPDYELEKLNAKPADGRNEGSSPFQSPEDEISPTTVSLVQNAPKFDSLYNQSFSKTPVSDDVMSPDPDDFPLLRQADSKSLLVDRMSQVDTKINTFEEAEPASHEMLTTDDLIPDMTTSVSSKSLQSATIRYPPPPRSKPVSTSGVDNSIDELEDSGEAFEMIIPDTHNALYARSSSRTSLEEKKHMYMPKSEPQETDESTDNMVTTLDDSAVSDSLIDPDEAEPLSSSRPKDDPKRIYQPKSQTPQENDESMDNSVPTLEDQPVLEISLDEEPSEAFVPKGEVRQPKIKDPTASTEKGVDSAVSPRATEEIVPVNASKTQTQPERESSPQNDADPSVDNSVSTLDDKPVSEMSLDDLLAGAYISSRDREGRELRAPPAQSRSRSSLNKEDDDLLSVDVEQIMPIQATESQAAPRDLSIDNAKPTLDDKPDSEMLNQQQPTGTHMSQPGSEGRQMKPPHSQDDEQSGEDNSRRLPEDTAGTKPAKMTHADITPDSLDASVDNSVSTLNDKPITEISLDDQPAGEFMTSLAGKGREMRAPHKRQSASQVPENLAAPGDLNVMDNSVPTHDEMPVSGILMGEEPAGERVSLRSGKGQVMNPSQSQTGEQGRRDNSDKVPITSEEISPTEAGQVQTVPDSLYTSMDNSVSTLNDKPNSEMSLDDQSAGGYMSSRGGEGRELRAPPTKTRVQSSPLNNDEDGSMPEDDEQISPEQPLQSSTNPAYQDGSVDNSISTMGEKPGMEILMADQPIGSDVSSDGKSGELKLPGKKDGSNLPHGNTEAKSSTEPHKGDDLITPLRAEVTRREPGDGQEQTTPDISENIVNSLDDNPVFEVPVDAQPLETRIKRDKGKGKELHSPSKYPDDKSEAAKSNNEEATPDTNQAEPEEIKEKTTTTNLKEKPSSLRSKLFSKSKKKPKEKESKPEKSKKSKEKTKAPQDDPDGSKSKNKNKKGEKGAPAVEDITTADMADPVKDQDKKADPSTNQPDGAALTDSNPNNRNVPESQDATVSTLTALTQLLTPDDLVPNSAKLDKSKKLSAPPSKSRKPSTTSTLPPDSDKTDAAAKPDKDHQIEEPRLDKSDLPMSETTSGIKRFDPDSLDENDNKPAELGSASATPNSSFSVISPSKTTISEGSPHDLAMMKGFKPISTDNQEQTLSDDSVSVDRNDSLHAMHSSEYIRKMKLQRELSPDSLTFNVSIDSLNKLSSNERSEMKFELGRDKRLSSSRHGSDSTPSPLPDGCTSPMHKSDIFINIDHPPKTEISAFSSPSRVYKELTPEPSTHILHFTQDATPVDGKQEKDSSHFNRSELRMSVGDHQVPKMGPEFEITFNAPADTDITLDDTDVVFGDDTMDVREPVSEGNVVPNYSSREKSQPRATPKTETVCVDIELSEPSSDKSITLDSAADTTQYMDLPSDLKTTTELTFDPMSSGKSATQLEGKPTEQQAKTPDKHRDLEPMAQSQARYEPSPDIPDGLTSHETISNAAPSKLGETGPELGLGSGRPAGQLAREPAEEKSNIPDNVSDSDPVTHSQPDTKQANDDTAPDDIKGTTAPAVSTEKNTKTSFDPLSADRHAAQQKSNTSDIDSANQPSALSQTDAEPSTNIQPDSENISPVAVLSAEPAVSVDADETSKKVNSEPDFSGVPAKQSSTQRPIDDMETSEPISSTPATDVIEPVTRSQLNTEPSSDKQTENVPSNDNEVSIKPAVSLELNSNPHPAPVSLPEPQGYEPIKSDTDDRLPDSPDIDSTSDPRAEDKKSSPNSEAATDPKEASESNSSPDTEMGLYPVGAPADDMTVDLLDPSPPSAAEEKSNIPDNVSDSDPVIHSQPDTKQANDDTAPDDIKGTTAPAVSTEENTKTSFDPLLADRHAAQQKSNTSDIDSANEPSTSSQTDAEPSANNQPDSENISPVAVLSAEPAVSVDADETSKKVNSEPDFSGVPAKQSSTQRPSDDMETSEPISSTPAADVIEPVTRSQLNTEPSSDKQTENVPSNDNEVSIKPAVSLELNSNPHPAPVSLPDPQGYEPIKSDTDDRLPDSPDRDSTSDPRAEDTTDPKEVSESNSSPDTEMGLYPVGAPADDMTVDLLDPSPPSAADETGSVSSEGQEYSRTETAETEEMIETSVEETVTMVITGVVANPGADEDEDEIVLSMQDAVSQGILDLQNGTFFNSTTRESISFIEAMNSGYIKMGPKKVEKTEEQVKSVGIISIKTVRETKPYTIKGAVDTRDGQMYHVFQATRRKILDSTKGSFTDLKSGNRMLIGDAVDRGLVQIEYDMNASGTIQEEITRTYSVHAVVDQREKVKLPFHEAVSRGLIDPEKGDYIHNITGIHVPVVEAIKKGFIKATETDKPENISVDSMGNKVAEKGVAAIRKKLINPLKVLKGMKH